MKKNTKIAIGVGAVALLGVAYYMYKKRNSDESTTTGKGSELAKGEAQLPPAIAVDDTVIDVKPTKGDEPIMTTKPMQLPTNGKPSTEPVITTRPMEMPPLGGSGRFSKPIQVNVGAVSKFSGVGGTTYFDATDSNMDLG